MRSFFLPSLLLVVVLTFGVAQPVSALNVWDGGGGDASWGTAGNWDASDTLPLFNGTENVSIGTGFTSGTTMTLDGDRHINSLTYTGTTTTINAGMPGTSKLILQSGNITRNTGSSDQTINVPIELRGNGTWHQNGAGGSVLRASSVISEAGGSRSLTVTGNRTLRLDGNNTFTGGLTINAGPIVRFNHNNAAGTGTLTFGNNSTPVTFEAITHLTIPNAVVIDSQVNFGAGSQGMTFTGPVTLTDTRTLQGSHSSADVVTFSGGIGDGGNGYGLNITGARAIRLSGNDTYTGPTIATGTQVNLFLNGTRQTSSITVNGSILTLQGDGVLGAGTLTFNSGQINSTGGDRVVNNAVSMGGNVTASINLSGLVTFNQQIELTDDLTVAAMQGASDGLAPVFAGGFQDNGNNYSLTLRGSNSRRIFVTGPSNYSGGTFVTDAGGSVVIRYQGGANLLPTTGLLSVEDTAAAGTATLEFLGGFAQTIGSLTGNGPINLGSSALTISGPGTQTYSGNLIGSGSVTIGGSVVQTFSTANSYTGGTSVIGGTLLVTNTTGSATGSGTVNVSGGTLGGTGIIGGSLSATGGAISPGASTGILTINGATVLGGSSKLVMEIGGTTPGAGGLGFHDQLFIDDALSILGNAELEISLVAGFVPDVMDVVTLITTTGPISGQFANTTSGFVNFGLYSAQITYTENSVFLSNFAPVPEPQTALLLIGFCALLPAARRKAIRRRQGQSMPNSGSVSR